MVWRDRTYLWNSDLVALLEELGVLLDELLGWNVLDGNTLLVVNAIQLDLKSAIRIRVFLRAVLRTSIFVLGLASCLIDNNQY